VIVDTGAVRKDRTPAFDDFDGDSTEWHDAPAATMNVGGGERLASLAAGAGLIALGLSRRSLTGVAVAAVGGMLAYRGWTGKCSIYRARGYTSRHGGGPQAETAVRNGVKVRLSTTIDRPAPELYRIWRDFEDLPKFMQHLESVHANDGSRSHWVAKGPLGKSLEWDAEIITDRTDEVISWRSLPGSQVDSAGSVRFSPAPQGRGTEVRVHFNYDPPAGSTGAALAWFLGESAQQQVENDLQRFKAFMESGTIPTAEGQPHGS
jgi:uncharacterized membrane protein